MNHEKETTTDSTSERQPSAAGIPATYLSLCSGYDGIGIALQRIYGGALRTLAHVEIEAFAIANLVAKMEEGSLDSCPVFTDVKRFPFEDLRGRVGILSAGFPCQPFSSAGKRQATEDPRHIYPYIADGITACRPAYVLLENVEGIISAQTADGESVLKHVLGDLEERGYTCAWGVFSACEIIGQDGRRIPHQRRRVFILAKLADRYVEGLEGHGGSIVESEASERDGEGNERLASIGSVQRSIYPARPNEPQRWWEEPRVVGELADSKSGKPRKSQGGDGRKDTGGGSEEEYVGDAKSLLREHSHGETDSGGCAQEETGGHGSSGGEEGGELADSRHAESSGRNEASEGCVQESLGESSPQDSGDGGKQLGDASSERPRGGSENRSDVESEVPRKGSESELEDSDGDGRRQTEGTEQQAAGSVERGEEGRQADLPETESELGGTTDAWGGLRGVDPITNRVDRLRLLGNGVVPATCELAFRTLYNRLNGDNEQQ